MVFATSGDRADHRFNGNRRHVMFTSSGATKSVAKGEEMFTDTNVNKSVATIAMKTDCDSQAVSEVIEPGDVCFDQYVEQGFNEEVVCTSADGGRRQKSSRILSDASSRQSRNVLVSESKGVLTATSMLKHPLCSLSGIQSASAARSSAGVATSVSENAAAAASMDNGRSDDGSNVLVIYERPDSEVTFNPNARRLRLCNAQQNKIERQSDVTATASNDSAERQWQEVMQRYATRRQQSSGSTTPSDSPSDSENLQFVTVRRMSSPKAQQEQFVSTTSRQVWLSPKQANGVATVDKKSERNRTSESRRREAAPSQVCQKQSMTATSKQERSAQRTGNRSAAPVVISSDSEVDEIEEQRSNGKKSRAKDVDGARRSAEHVASAGHMDYDEDCLFTTICCKSSEDKALKSRASQVSEHTATLWS